MNYLQTLAPQIARIEQASSALGFVASCDLQVANFCAVLVAGLGSRRVLELGTGTGLSTLFLAQALAEDAHLVSVDIDAKCSAVAAQVINEARVQLEVADAGAFLKACQPNSYDFIFADAWPGKFSHLDVALEALAPNGLYLIDDLLPQDNWPKNHQPRVEALLAALEAMDGFALSYLNWASGLAVVYKLDDRPIAPEIRRHADYAFLFSETMPSDI